LITYFYSYIKLQKELEIDNYQAVVLAVAHNEFRDLDIDNKDKVVFDIKALLDKNIVDGRL
jgi:UDP-N-acetyl-D-galactosamine dehydrogenase